LTINLAVLIWLSEISSMTVSIGRSCLLRKLWRCSEVSRLLLIHFHVISIGLHVMVFRIVGSCLARSAWIWLTFGDVVCIFNWGIYIGICCLCKICKWGVLTIYDGCLEIQLSEGITLVIELIVLDIYLFILGFNALIVT